MSTRANSATGRRLEKLIMMHMRLQNFSPTTETEHSFSRICTFAVEETLWTKYMGFGINIWILCHCPKIDELLSLHALRLKDDNEPDVGNDHRAFRDVEITIRIILYHAVWDSYSRIT
jgi:hypothetical protein